MSSIKDARHQDLTMNFGFSFDDLYDREGLMRLDAAFLNFLSEADEALHAKLEAERSSIKPITKEQTP